MSDLYVARLVQYGIESGLIPEEERIYSTNQILEVMKKMIMRHRQPKKSAQRSIWQIHWSICWTRHWRAVCWRTAVSFPEICLIQS